MLGNYCYDGGCILNPIYLSEITEEKIIKLLEDNIVSIGADIEYQILDDTQHFNFIFYLKPRCVGKDKVNISYFGYPFTYPCTFNIDNECKMPKDICLLTESDITNKRKEVLLKYWLPYQSIMVNIIKKLTNQDFHQRFLSELEEEMVNCYRFIGRYIYNSRADFATINDVQEKMQLYGELFPSVLDQALEEFTAEVMKGQSR